MSLGIMPMQWDSHARTMRLMSVIIISLLLALPHDAISVSGDPFDWDALMLYALPLLRSSRTYQVSSSDPTGGNDDKGHYVEHRGNVAVLMDVKGAGCIYRIWSANPSGTLRIFVDDDNPILMMPFREIFTHHREPFIKPFVGRDGGGGYCYIPIPFARRCRVEVLNPPSLYYQITYCQRKSEAGISSFTPIKARASVRNWLKRWQRWLATPTPATQPQHYSKVTVLPNGKKALFALTGSGMITHLALRIKPFTLKALHSLRLQLYWDGERQPSIDCPIADLFCAAFGWVQSQSLFIDTSTHQLVLRLPMPYGNGARCEMVNEGKEAVDVECSLWTTPLPHPPSAYGRLHAQFHIATTQSDIPYTILDARGRGHLVGIVAALGGTSYEFLEGDLNVAVDGET
ncbi:MAG TPA: DUF2961 domain-containing protein, partial [Armatimonadetes bacterium]|nr:DUF2961 domain-containing protein [Armatimonadota bacterium]